MLHGGVLGVLCGCMVIASCLLKKKGTTFESCSFSFSFLLSTV
ncbi:hypothetical protein HMPREF3202_00953 [Prevotella bivia]|uniref:Uncharacterized protein n=1 Tax=Prevotella bivia TaxID=28125 RepID=A0A137SYV3_9BACT|nr:hypothetical protein HMPREF3202_00953 [Prevotella bivia]